MWRSTNLIKRSKVNEVDFFEQDNEQEITHCQNCKSVGIISVLQGRLYGENEEPSSDDENWKQCYKCGKIVEIYNVQHENDKLKGFTEPVENPFDFGQNQVDGLTNRRSNMKKRKQEEDYDYIKDSEIKAQLKHGDILLDYSESMS